MKKRLLSVIMVIAMVFSLLPTTVFATDDAELVVAAGNVTADLSAGNTVSVPVTFEQNSGVAQIRVEVLWNDEALKLTGVDFEAMAAVQPAPIEETVGSYTVWAGDPLAAEDYTGTNENVFVLNFEILDGAQAGTYEISLNVLEALNAAPEAKTAAAVNGSVTLEAVEEEEPVHDKLQKLPENAYNDTNLWEEMTPLDGYYKGDGKWSKNYKSIIIPVVEGDKIYCSSFQNSSITGGTSNGIAVNYFYGNANKGKMKPAAVYDEFSKNGYLTVPAGVNAVCIPTWYPSEANPVINLLTLPERPDNTVAKIGDAKYDTLADAVEAVEPDETIELVKDITLTEAITVDKPVTIDLGGNTITATSSIFMVKDNAALDLQNGTVNATGEGIVVWSVGTGTDVNDISLEDVTLTADTFVVYHNGTKYGANVNISNSTITSNDTVAVYLAGRATVDSSWPENCNNTLVINAGTTITGKSAVEVKRGDVTVADGAKLVATGEASMTPNTNGPASSGYALALTSNAGKAIGSATVEGGEFKGAIGIEVNEGSTNEAAFAVSGGTFDRAVPAEYCADGFEPTQNTDGSYGVKVEVPKTYVAKIGDEEFETLADAVEAAGEDDTIVLTQDIELSAMIEIAKPVSIDLNGKTITANTSVFYVKNGATLNLANGTIYADDVDDAIPVWSVGMGSAENTIVLDGVELYSNTFAIYHNGSYYGADVTVANSSIVWSNKSVAIYLAGRATVDEKWPEGKNNKLTIEDSCIVGDTAVEVKRGDVIINRGELMATGENASMTPNTSGPVSSGYALAVTGNEGIAVGSATITEGIITGAIGIEVTEGVANKATFAVSGGTFDREVPAEYCAEGFEPADNGDGTYGVKEEVKELTIGYNLTLESCIDFSFFMYKKDIPAGATVTISQGTESKEITWENYNKTMYRFRYTDVAPAEYEDQLTLCVKDADGKVIAEKTESIKSYAELRVEKAEEDAPMMEALLAYCAACKTYFKK